MTNTRVITSSIELTYAMHNNARMAAAEAEHLTFDAFIREFDAGHASTAGLYAEWLVRICRLNCIIHGVPFPAMEVL